MSFIRRWYDREEQWNKGLQVAQDEFTSLGKADPHQILHPDLPRMEFLERYPAEVLNWQRDSADQDQCHQFGLLAALGLSGFAGFGTNLLMRQVPSSTKVARVAGAVALGSLAFLWVARYKGQKCLREGIGNPDSRQSQLVRQKIFETIPEHWSLEDFRKNHPNQARRENIFDVPSLESDEQQPQEQDEQQQQPQQQQEE